MRIAGKCSQRRRVAESLREITFSTNTTWLQVELLELLGSCEGTHSQLTDFEEWRLRAN